MKFKDDNIDGTGSKLSGQPFSDPIANSVVTHAADHHRAGAEQPNGDGIADAVVDAQAQQNGNAGTSAANTTSTTVTKTVDDDPMPPQIEGEEDLLKYLVEQRDANRRLTLDDVKKLRRKQRTEEIVSGISDAVRSLSNLYFTSQYAPNMYDHSKGMSEATKARWDKAWKEREAENDRYLNFALKGHGIRAQRAATMYQHQQDKIKADREDRKQDRLEARDAWQAQARQLELEIKQAQIAGNQELANQKLEELKRHNQAMERNGYISATRPRTGTRNPDNYSDMQKMWIYRKCDEYGIKKTEVIGYGKTRKLSIHELAGKVADYIDEHGDGSEYDDYPGADNGSKDAGETKGKKRRKHADL